MRRANLPCAQPAVLRHPQSQILRRASLLCATIATCLITATGPVAAQEQEDPAVIATARELAIAGVKLAQADRCPDAVPKLERAEKLHHSPIVLTRLGDCYIKLGQLIAGIESLRSVLREPLPENPSEALQSAYTEASALVEATKPKLAKLTIKVRGLEAGDDTDVVDLRIDDKSMPSALLGTAQVSDPGDHRVDVSAPGYLASHATVTIAPGGSESLEMKLEPDPNAKQLQNAQLLPPPAPQVPDASTFVAAPAVSSPNHLPAYITWGLSAAMLGVGVGFGFAAMENQSVLEDRCPDKVCPQELADLIDTSRTNAMISTIGIGAGLGGAALGALLFWLESGGSPDRDPIAGPTSSVETQARTAPVRVNARGVAISF